MISITIILLYRRQLLCRTPGDKVCRDAAVTKRPFACEKQHGQQGMTEIRPTHVCVKCARARQLFH